MSSVLYLYFPTVHIQGVPLRTRTTLTTIIIMCQRSYISSRGAITIWILSASFEKIKGKYCRSVPSYVSQTFTS